MNRLVGFLTDLELKLFQFKSFGDNLTFIYTEKLDVYVRIDFLKMELVMITSPAELWKCLCSKAGLELKLGKGKPGRDADIEDALRLALNIPDNALSLEAWLRNDAALPNPTVSTETFLIEVLKSQSGFARMMQDILDLLIEANALQASNQLSVEFKFDEVNDPIKATLGEFRETVQRTQSVLEKRPKLPKSEVMWSLSGTLRKFIPNYLSSRPPENFPAVSPIKKTGHQNVDTQLRAITELVSAFRELWLKYGDTRRQVGQAGCSELLSDETRSQLIAATDFWDIGVLEGARVLSTQINSEELTPADVFNMLNTELSKIEWSHIWIENTFKELLDILNLPAWRRRHELYSVWVGTRMLAVIRSVVSDVRFHLVDNVLSFAFGGSRLATFNWNNKQYDVWAELRSALVGQSSKRKKGIQPDFRVLQVDISKSSGLQTTYVLECKHYLNASKQNFIQAAADYARSCPQAIVHLVNHGPADENTLRENLSPELQARTKFIGDATPLKELSEKVVSESIRNALFPGVSPESDLAETQPVQTLSNDLEAIGQGFVGYIQLEWDDTLDDMDLSLQMISSSGQVINTVDFRNRGAVDASPFSCFDCDVRTGPGKERIDISRWLFSRYKVIATNYSRTGMMTSESLRCQIVIGAERMQLHFPSKLSETSIEWHIAELVVCNGIPTVKVL
ncbi:hypothetical protein ABC502_18320 [Alkalimonas sp. NCh-2]|uniref:hypothetical protein n=1 Tax=Alkalimonas sp. NCh-2 TaxID=3144846 RepID=UPI0031F69D96